MKSWKKSGLMHRNQLTSFTFSEDLDSILPIEGKPNTSFIMIDRHVFSPKACLESVGI